MKKLLLCLLAFIMCGCGASSESVSGKISLDGSTSMEKYVNGLKEMIVEEYPDLQLEPQFTGSSSGIQSVINKKADIGNSSRNLKQEELDQGVVENIVAIDGIAVIVHKDNSVSDLTKDQLISIYKGEIVNWNELGGSDEPIVVVGREASSGTRGAFEEILDIEGACQYARELNETGAVVAAVQSTNGAIGYVSLDVVGDSVKALSLDGVTPSIETIQNGSYSLQRPFVMATLGTIEEQNEQVKAMFEFIYSEKGKELAQLVGLVPVEKK